MARLKLSALVSSMEGSLNGSSIHTGKGGTYLRNKSYPKQSNTMARVNSVNQFSSLVSQWSALTAAQKNQWNDFTRKHAEKTKDGDKYNPGGYAHFLAYNRLRNSAKLPTLLAPGTFTGKPYNLNFSVSEFFIGMSETENIIQSLILNIQPPGDIIQDSSYVVSISQPLGKTSTRNFGTMYPIGYFRIPSGYAFTESFLVLLPDIKPNPLIALQSNRPYAITLTPLSDTAAIYEQPTTSLATTELQTVAPAIGDFWELSDGNVRRINFSGTDVVSISQFLTISGQTIPATNIAYQQFIGPTAPTQSNTREKADYYFTSTFSPIWNPPLFALARTISAPAWQTDFIQTAPVNFFQGSGMLNSYKALRYQVTGNPNFSRLLYLNSQNQYN